jgi:hypothetical protein
MLLLLIKFNLLVALLGGGIGVSNKSNNQPKKGENTFGKSCLLKLWIAD